MLFRSGPQGGHRLAKHPSEYTVGMILRLTEGSLSPVACLDDEVNQCTRQAQCATLELWKKLDKAISDVVDNVTLEDLVQWQINKNSNYISYTQTLQTIRIIANNKDFSILILSIYSTFFTFCTD